MDRVGNTIPGVVLRCFSWNLFSPLVRGLCRSLGPQSAEGGDLHPLSARARFLRVAKLRHQRTVSVWHMLSKCFNADRATSPVKHFLFCHGHVTDRLAGKHARGASRCPCACVGEILMSAFMDPIGNTIPGVVLRCFSWNLFSPLVRGHGHVADRPFCLFFFMDKS